MDGRIGQRPRSVVSAWQVRLVDRPSMAREFFTVDLRGLRAALTARAAEARMTESDLLRSALAVALRDCAGAQQVPSASTAECAVSTEHVKMSVRIARSAARRLEQQARAAGLSRGAYLAQLIDGAPAVLASTDRRAGFAALSASATELAVLSRDISHLNHLLRIGEFRPALEYRERLETLDADVRRHLDLAASVLARLSPSKAILHRARIGRARHCGSRP
jgi:hypothetical protein